MRRFTLALLWLAPLLACGCLNPNSQLNPNRGEHHDEWSIHDEARAGESLETDYNDGLDNWIHSPKYRAINRDLGYE